MEEKKKIEYEIVRQTRNILATMGCILSRTSTLAFRGHRDRVSSVAFQPTNGSLLATGSYDGTAKVWNTETGECIMTLEGHTRGVSSVAFHSTNASILATGSFDETAKIWNTETGECIMTLEGHANMMMSVAFHPTNTSLLATGSYDGRGSYDGTAKVWNTETGECIMTLTGHTHWVNSVAFHPTNASLLATGSKDGTAKFWNTETGKCIDKIGGCSSLDVQSIAFDPTDPTRFATGAYDCTARLWSVGSKLRRQIESEFGAAHPIVVKTLAGDAYTLEDWGLCKDLKAAVCELAPASLGEPPLSSSATLATAARGAGRCRLTASTAATTGTGCW